MQEIIFGTLSKTLVAINGLAWVLLYGVLSGLWTLGLLVLPFGPLKYYDEKVVAKQRNLYWSEVIAAISWIIIYSIVYMSLTLTLIERWR